MAEMTNKHRAIREANTAKEGPAFRINLADSVIVARLVGLKVAMEKVHLRNEAFRVQEVLLEAADAYVPQIISLLLASGEVYLWEISSEMSANHGYVGGGFHDAIDFISQVKGVELILP